MVCVLVDVEAVEVAESVEEPPPLETKERLMLSVKALFASADTVMVPARSRTKMSDMEKDFSPFRRTDRAMAS